ncbi:MAG: enoyl-CoA hydratase [Cycloclasticus sp. symbiont of Bathymodiolus heckerae]|nr:MAG: enoyl-CoA hydratase [Cycloclasticus sp. symbiont of Bathymodiolus heckerae]
MSKTILVTKSDGVALLKMNDLATMNAITDPVILEDVISAFEDIQSDDSIRVAVLTGVDRAFSSGGNVKDMLERKKMFAGEPLVLQNGYRKGIHRLSTLMYSFEKPLIAAINGAAVGAGMDLAMLCDLRIASDKARFGSTFINLGIIPGDGGAWLLNKVVGAQRAAEMVLSGRIVKADEALEMGLVLKVVAQDSLVDEAMTLARSIACKSPEALKIAKRLLNSADRLSFTDHLDLCSANQAMLHHTPEHEAALQTFFAKK